jgi:homoserine dehydrogenase
MSETSPSAPPTPCRLLLLGYGHVAQAFLPLLASRSAWMERELGIVPVISGIGSRSQGLYIHADGVSANELASKLDPLRFFQSSGTRVERTETFIQTGAVVGASLLIELTTLNPHNGEPALTHIRQALTAGMDAITANKGPVAFAQAGLQALARQHHIQFRFESTVMDGFPLFNLAQFTLPAVGIQSFRGLLNSTSGLVLDRIAAGYTLDEAIQQAQQLGIAEADPWYDLDGWDAVMKTTILANTLLEGQVTPAAVRREGIRGLAIEDMRSAARAGAPFRLVSSASRKDGAVIAAVRPLRIGTDDILHIGKGTTGVICLETEAMGTITLVEHEPTVLQTAYGVLSDLITVLRRRGTD